jgi:hypothetical protein
MRITSKFRLPSRRSYIRSHGYPQELAKTYHQIVLARKRVADSLLNHYLPLYFPEMGRYWESTRVDWFVAFLENRRVTLTYEFLRDGQEASRSLLDRPNWELSPTPPRNPQPYDRQYPGSRKLSA